MSPNTDTTLRSDRLLEPVADRHLRDVGAVIIKVEQRLALSHETLERQADRLMARRPQGFVRRCHGDLHLGNICLIDGRPTLFDCVEFSDEVACIDVLYDVAFLLMDLQHRTLGVHAHVVYNEYAAATGDLDGLSLLHSSCRRGRRCEPGPAPRRRDCRVTRLTRRGGREGATRPLRDRRVEDVTGTLVVPTKPSSEQAL